MFSERNAQCTVHPINAYVRSFHVIIYTYTSIQLKCNCWIWIESELNQIELNWMEWNVQICNALFSLRSSCVQCVRCTLYSVHDVNSLISKRVIRTLLYRIRRERNFNCESLLRATYSRESSWINSQSNFNKRIYKMRWWLRQQML